VNIHTSKQILT